MMEEWKELFGKYYWNKLKQRLKEERNEMVTNRHQLKMKATDGCCLHRANFPHYSVPRAHKNHHLP